MIHNIEDWEDIRVYDLMVEAGKHVNRCKAGTDNWLAWSTIYSCFTAYGTLEQARRDIEIVASQCLSTPRKRIYKKWLAGTERYVR